MRSATLAELCEKCLNFSFRDPRMLEAALRHASSADSRKESNERLEFLGDAVLGLIICQELYERLPDLLEGDLTKIKSAVVSRRVCAQVAERLQLADSLIVGQGLEAGSNLPRSLLAATLEAVIAAIYLDSGLQAARAFILEHFARELNAAIASDHQFNFKSQLQQHAQRVMNATPAYQLLDEKGPDHAKCFEIAVSIAGRQFPGAWGPSKKEAEQKAAWLALMELGVPVPSYEEESARLNP